MINMEETNKTIEYYNINAAQYFSNTVDVDMSECCDRFLKYVAPGGRIIDIGARSGYSVDNRFIQKSKTRDREINPGLLLIS